MSEDYSAAAERIVNATNLVDDDLSTFEDDVRAVALGYLAQAARIKELESALVGLAMRSFVHDRSWCWCGGVVYDPTTHRHEPECTRARAALAGDADA